jgi:hypothetical protein
MVNVKIVDHGMSIVVFHILSAEAQAWVDDLVDVPDHMLWGANGFCVEHRYARDLADALVRDGFTVA